MVPSVCVSSLIHCCLRHTLLFVKEMRLPSHMYYHVVFGMCHFSLLHVKSLRPSEKLLRMVNSACCTTTTPICRYVQCISLKPQFIFFCFGPPACFLHQLSSVSYLDLAVWCSLWWPLVFLIYTNHISHLHQSYFSSIQLYLAWTQIIFLIYTKYISNLHKIYI